MGNNLFAACFGSLEAKNHKKRGKNLMIQFVSFTPTIGGRAQDFYANSINYQTLLKFSIREKNLL